MSSTESADAIEVSRLIEHGIQQSTTDPAAALANFRQAIEIDPRSVQAWSLAGSALEALGRSIEALAAFDAALALAPADRSALLGKGYSLMTVGRSAEALCCFDKDLTLNPESYAAKEGRGLALHELGRFAEAFTCFVKLVGVARNSYGRGWAWHYAAASLLQLGRPDSAIKCANRALGEDPGLSAAWVTKGNCHRALCQFEESIECYKRAVANNGGSWTAWFNKALVEEDLGRSLEAADSYARCIALAPPFEHTRIRAHRRQHDIILQSIDERENRSK